ncbi:serine/threonine-protein phosphatase 2a regulatory subunit b'' subunit gamma [Anaeramoeba ignava]|uniref:Serine/threonine-protein phosphatase 2a regulatory subunit b'' subunit gamma n=1 Tax=Anaeramoeba ignava TaxID=1746090 RepID=A0A9Q0L6D8_ANAIG|nr:serine/threonine-protein phosphatase 2a regulatory subunit b'' subunit gamma [Anaeramoeba ignava]
MLPNWAINLQEKNKLRNSNLSIKKKEQEEKDKFTDDSNYSLKKINEKMNNLLKRSIINFYIKKQEQNSLQIEDLQILYNSIMENSVEFKNESWINYESFSKARESLPLKLKRFLKPSYFLRFKQNKKGEIESANLLVVIMYMITFENNRIKLMKFDSEGNHRLNEIELRKFLLYEANTIGSLQEIPQPIKPLYLSIITKKIYFVLKKTHNKEIDIDEFAMSDVLEEFSNLKNAAKLSANEEKKNWFSIKSVMSIIQDFARISDNEDKLTKEQFERLGGVTNTFVDLLFQELPTNRMTFDNFIDYVLASTYLSTNCIASLKYFWKVFDIKKNGKFDMFSLRFFFQEISQDLEKMKAKPINIDWIRDEIFDMINPKNRTYITFNDIVDSKRGDNFFRILMNTEEFVEWEERESN